MLVKTTDGTPDAVKVARPVWSGGKSGDNFKGLPIAIRQQEPGREAAGRGRRCCPDRRDPCPASVRVAGLSPVMTVGGNGNTVGNEVRVVQGIGNKKHPLGGVGTILP